MKTSFAAALHDVRSAHNVGSIFRTADSAGFEKIFLCGITPGPLDRWGGDNPKVTKVSLGAEKSVAWEREETTEKAIMRLKESGWRLVGVEIMPDAVSLFDCSREIVMGEKKFPDGEKDVKIALVMGSEVSGLSSEILAMCDIVVSIPMCGMKESLNVSVAFGIVAYKMVEIFRDTRKNPAE
jgi:tRNA G18 (ribose-2'-O)-methylase SpoU